MKTYTGGCHCGKVRYEVKTDLSQVFSCNCSHCSRHGIVPTFVPADQFELVSGADHLVEYLFNKKVLHHLFCKTCGVESFARSVDPQGNEMVAINAICLDDVDVSTLTLTPFDGKSV
jgi:hypothetical protein